jgi:hypothetical protein
MRGQRDCPGNEKFPPAPATTCPTLLAGLETGVRKVVVSELKDDTFYALIWLEKDGRLISVDSRPSDALAIALRLDCPIYVDESVLNSSKAAGAITEKINNEEIRKWLEGLGDEDWGTRCVGQANPCPDHFLGAAAEALSLPLARPFLPAGPRYGQPTSLSFRRPWN